MKRRDFLSSLKSGVLERVYWFAGPEEWLKHSALERLRKALLPEGLESLNENLLEGASARQIIEAAETLPVMAERRLVVVRDWQPFLSKGNSDKAERERMIEWLASPSDSTVLVFYYRAENVIKLAPDKPPLSLMTVVDFSPLTDAELATWAKRQLKDAGKEIDPPALEALTYLVGRDLARLSIELDKLAAYALDRSLIQESDVHAVVSVSLDFDVYNLLSELLRRDLGEAQRIAGDLKRDGQDSVRILSSLEWQMRNIVYAQYGKESKPSAEQVQRLTENRSLYPVRKAFDQASRRPPEVFRRLYRTIVDMESGIKSGKVRAADALDRVMYEISAS